MRSDSLAHVPRRAVGMAKDLRRMGYDVVPKTENGMSRDVKAVTDVAGEVAKLGARARDVGDKLRRNVDDTHAALDIAENMSDALGAAAADLRSILGVQTNSPPKDTEQHE